MILKCIVKCGRCGRLIDGVKEFYVEYADDHVCQKCDGQIDILWSYEINKIIQDFRREKWLTSSGVVDPVQHDCLLKVLTLKIDYMLGLTTTEEYEKSLKELDLGRLI